MDAVPRRCVTGVASFADSAFGKMAAIADAILGGKRYESAGA